MTDISMAPKYSAIVVYIACRTDVEGDNPSPISTHWTEHGAIQASRGKCGMAAAEYRVITRNVVQFEDGYRFVDDKLCIIGGP